jgi:hypothetical protein
VLVRSYAVGTMPEAMTDADWILELFNYEPTHKTIDVLVRGAKSDKSEHHYHQTGLPASRVRRAIGELYGLGFVKVVEVVNGEPVWAKTSLDERCGL